MVSSVTHSSASDAVHTRSQRLPGTYARFVTSEGNFTIRLFDQEAPRTVQKPYYDGTIFHRVIDGFMIQGGDPLGQGIGGPGYNFADEFHPKLRHNKAG